MLLFAAYKTLLARLSGQNDLIVGVPYESGVRDLPGGSRLFANTTNMLPLRTLLDPAKPFTDLLAATKSQVLETAEHQECFFGDLLPKLATRAELGRPTLFGVTFNYETGKFSKDAGVLHFELVTDSVPYRNARDVSPFDLVMNVAEQDGALLVECDYNTDLFAAQTIERWLGHYQTLLEGIAATPETPLNRLPLLSEEDRQQTLLGWNDTRRDYPTEFTLHALIEAQAERTPDAIAVAFERQNITYRELNRRANQVARHRLRSSGSRPRTPSWPWRRSAASGDGRRTAGRRSRRAGLICRWTSATPSSASPSCSRTPNLARFSPSAPSLASASARRMMPRRIFLEDDFSAESDANPELRRQRFPIISLTSFTPPAPRAAPRA